MPWVGAGGSGRGERLDAFDTSAGDDDGRTERVEDTREAGTDAGARAGDDGNFAVETEGAEGVETIGR